MSTLDSLRGRVADTESGLGNSLDRFWADVRRRKQVLDKKIEDNVADTKHPDSVTGTARNAVAAGLQAANKVLIPESTTEAAADLVAGPVLGVAAGRAGRGLRALREAGAAAPEFGEALSKARRARELIPEASEVLDLEPAAEKVANEAIQSGVDVMKERVQLRNRIKQLQEPEATGTIENGYRRELINDAKKRLRELDSE